MFWHCKYCSFDVHDLPSKDQGLSRSISIISTWSLLIPSTPLSKRSDYQTCTAEARPYPEKAPRPSPSGITIHLFDTSNLIRHESSQHHQLSTAHLKTPPFPIPTVLPLDHRTLPICGPSRPPNFPPTTTLSALGNPPPQHQHGLRRPPQAHPKRNRAPAERAVKLPLHTLPTAHRRSTQLTPTASKASAPNPTKTTCAISRLPSKGPRSRPTKVRAPSQPASSTPVS